MQEGDVMEASAVLQFTKHRKGIILVFVTILPNISRLEISSTVEMQD